MIKLTKLVSTFCNPKPRLSTWNHMNNHESYESYNHKMLLEQPKEELNLKWKTSELMNNSMQTTDKAIESLASSMTHLGDTIKDRVTL